MTKNTSLEALPYLQAVRSQRGIYVWKAFMKKFRCDYVCELGVFSGANFRRMIEHSPKVAVAIDSWTDDGIISRNDGGFSQIILDKLYEDFTLSMTDKPFVKIYREYTFDAVKHFKNNYFDVVYIDADHSYQGCLRDINNWFPKVKRGRFLLGDDYRIYQGRRPGVTFGVIEAVGKFAKENNLKFFLLPHYGWGIIKT